MHILVSYPWQPRIIAPYSETCAYCILVSYSWQPHIIAPYSKSLVSYPWQPRIIVHILVSYPWQPRIIAPYSETCAYCILVSYSWQPHIIHILGNHRILKRCIFLCHILGNLILLHCILKGAYSCVIFLATSYYCTIFRNMCIFLCHILGNLVLLHCILKSVLVLLHRIFLCHILGNLVLPEFGSSSVF